MQRKKLPIGIQTLREIREEGCYYVDKTPIALQLIDQGKYFFLSRPRRFGKSLFLDTLKELFEGNRALFTGLYADTHWDWSVKFPVLRFSFGSGVLGSVEDLQESLHTQLTQYEQLHSLPSDGFSPSIRFAQLLRRLAEQSGKRVVVLADDYDKPVFDNIEDQAKALKINEMLQGFFSVIKDSDAHVHFALLAGVFRFSTAGIFSGLNNLMNITLNSRYSAICGYTDHDVDTVFAPELFELDREKIRRWYNGYNWLGEAVYNPFDLLLLFRNRRFRPYWFETGTPTFLIKLLASRGFFTPQLGALRTGAELISSFDVDNIVNEALLFQTGYLTIEDVRPSVLGEDVYTLSYPNLEVQTSLNASLLQGLGADSSSAFHNRQRLGELLLAGDMDGLRTLFHAFFASIPHDWYRNNPIAQYEGYWASVFYSYFAALRLQVVVEDSTNQGRIDMAVRFQGQTWLFEFKVVELVPEGKALQQLQDKGYADKYLADGPVHLVGVEFSRESRNIVAFETEKKIAASLHSSQ